MLGTPFIRRSLEAYPCSAPASLDKSRRWVTMNHRRSSMIDGRFRTSGKDPQRLCGRFRDECGEIIVAILLLKRQGRCEAGNSMPRFTGEVAARTTRSIEKAARSRMNIQRIASRGLKGEAPERGSIRRGRGKRLIEKEIGLPISGREGRSRCEIRHFLVW